MSGPVSDAKVWKWGGAWVAFARHPNTRAWIKVCGIPTKVQAIAEADALALQLDREDER